MIRVLVVEDSLTVRRHLVGVLSADPEIEVVGEAADGATGVALCGRLRPDVATFDMVLPELDGLAAVEHIMAYFPTPIVIVSASENRGEVLETYDALRAGAIDVLDKPKDGELDGEWAARLCATVKLVARIKPITHPRARLRDRARAHAEESRAAVTPARRPPSSLRAIAIGASTGGPGAVAEILRALPRDFDVPVFVVIHVGATFNAGLVDWLGRQTALPVATAVAGEPLPRGGRVLLATPDHHLSVSRGRLTLTRAAERNHCRPSVDVLFESLALELGPSVLACLLTGMGKDGAEGLLAVRKAGGVTVAQDEATSVVFGMPREAILRGAALHVLPIAQIAGLVLSARTGHRAAGGAP